MRRGFWERGGPGRGVDGRWEGVTEPKWKDVCYTENKSPQSSTILIDSTVHIHTNPFFILNYFQSVGYPFWQYTITKQNSLGLYSHWLT